ncbi:MAG: sulfotransferase family 2 domain-containing protein [Henriciella sp.]|nr:sulfotransferase family 2 domain-containing protein [Henriciella sp.]
MDLKNQYSDDSFVIFLHIQKTAGMTLQRYLRKQFGPGLVRRIWWKISKDPRIDGDVVTAARARRKSDGFFAGHFAFGMHENLPKPATYMAFFREPVSRVISLYKHSKNDEGSYYHEFAKNQDLRGFVTESGLMELDNGMVRFLCGEPGEYFINRVPVGSVDDAMLKKAIENFDRYFFFGGIQEMFDESFLLLAQKLGDTDPKYLTLNVAKPNAGQPFDDETKEMIRRSNAYDMTLYDHVKRRFERELAEAFPDLDQRLDRLQTANTAYNGRTKTLNRMKIAINRNRAGN